ncbi:hypothetical protein KN1_17110 [Stygiolobus caldivivus]|uniref:Uncharacterized protein n=1 Tax=Stygiolobus caldivivus TaxID=2824673 RepID=A0A8D5U6V9_9CREN|nr:hypothetical protein KN1_17110 [Stygiolobus caldivivus]
MIILDLVMSSRSMPIYAEGLVYHNRDIIFVLYTLTI